MRTSIPFDVCLEQVQPGVPSSRDAVEVSACHFEFTRFQAPLTVPSDTFARHEPHLVEEMEMFSDRLAGYCRAFPQANGWQWSFVAEPRDYAKADRIAKGQE